MEVAELSFTFDYEGHTKRVYIKRENENGLTAAQLCEAFEDFMESAGFDSENIYDYFHK